MSVRWPFNRQLSNPLILHVTHPSATDSSFSSGPGVESPGFLPNDPFASISPSPSIQPPRPASPIPPGSSDEGHLSARDSSDEGHFEHVPNDWGLRDPDSSDEEEVDRPKGFTTWTFPLTPPGACHPLKAGVPSPLNLDLTRVSLEAEQGQPAPAKSIRKARSLTSLLSRAGSPTPSVHPSTPTPTSTLVTGLLPSSAIASALLAAPRPVTPPPSPPPPPAVEEDDLAPPPALRVARKVRSLTSLLHSSRPLPPPRASTSNLRPRTSMGDLLFKRAESDPAVPTRSRPAQPPKSPLPSLFSHSPSKSSINYSRPITPSTPKFSFASLRHTPPPSPSKSHGHGPTPRTPLRDVFSLHPHSPPKPESTHDVCPSSSPTTGRKSSTLTRAAAKLIGIHMKPLPVLPTGETSPRSLLFRDEDEEEVELDDEEEWVKCVGGEMVRPRKRGRGRLEGVQWGSADGTGIGTGTGEWDGEKKGVQVDGRW